MHLGAGEIAQLFRTFAEDLGLVPISHMAAHPGVTQFQGSKSPFCGLHGYQTLMWYTY